MREPTNPGRRIAPTYPPLRDLPDVDTTADTRSATAQLAEDLLQDVSRSMRETSIQDSPEATAARRKANEALANLNEAAANLAAEAQKESAIDKRFKAMEAEYMAFKERSRQRQIEYQEQMSEAMMYIRPP